MPILLLIFLEMLVMCICQPPAIFKTARETPEDEVRISAESAFHEIMQVTVHCFSP